MEFLEEKISDSGFKLKYGESCQLILNNYMYSCFRIVRDSGNGNDNNNGKGKR